MLIFVVRFEPEKAKLLMTRKDMIAVAEVCYCV